MKKMRSRFVWTLFLLLSICISVSRPVNASGLSESGAATPRPSVNGMLHVNGTTLSDSNGNVAVLRGLSTHGITWYPDFVNEELFAQVSSEWNCNLIRLAVYSDEFVNGNRAEILDLVRRGIDAAKAAARRISLQL